MHYFIDSKINIKEIFHSKYVSPWFQHWPINEINQLSQIIKNNVSFIFYGLYIGIFGQLGLLIQDQYDIKVIGAQGLGPLGDQTKRADRHKVPEESRTKKGVILPISNTLDSTYFKHPRHLPLHRNSQICLISWKLNFSKIGVTLTSSKIGVTLDTHPLWTDCCCVVESRKVIKNFAFLAKLVW